MAQQLGPAIERATFPFQYALTTRACTECIAHLVQALTDADPSATVLSIDGIGEFDLVSRQSMLDCLGRVEGGDFLSCRSSTGLHPPIYGRMHTGNSTL